MSRTDTALGHGSYADLRDVVWVTAERLDARRGRELAAELRRINATLEAAGRRYLLIGPGRWGSSDPTLGIGVVWTDIHRAHVIVETPIGTRRVEPSQGTHFFRNITSARIGYLTVTDNESSWLDRDWLRAHATTDGSVVHLALDEPLSVIIDGRRGQGVIALPDPAEEA